MAVTVEMPALGESVTEGTVTRWLKSEGDTVEVDEPLLEVSTDKVDTEIPSPAAGVLKRIIAGEDETVEVGGELAVIGDADESDGDAGGSGGAEQATEQTEQATEEPEPEPEPAHEAAPKQEPGGSSGGGSGSGTPVTMPELGESVTEGTVTRWLKQVGDTVDVDEALLEVSTDKVDTEIPSPVAGTVLEHTVGEDETVEVGAQLALVGDGSAAPAESSAPAQEAPAKEEAPAPKKEEPAAEKKPEPKPEPKAEQPKAEAPKQQQSQPAGSTDTQGGASSSNGSGDRPYVTPLVRKLAQEHGVDLESLTGSGVGGRIRKQDVLAAAEQKSAPAAEAPAAPAASGGAPKQPQTVPTRPEDGPQPGTTVKLPRLRQVIAQRMNESLAVSAQLTTVQEVDLTRIVKLRNKVKEDFKRREGANLTFLAFIAKATIEALKAFPSVNASISEDNKQVTYHGSVHMGIAVDTPRGLLVPVIKDADDLSLAGIAKKIADVAARTRNAKIGPDELSGGTFTITNIGSAGALFDTPILNQPQVGILGTGAIVKEPKVVTGPEGDDVIAVRSVCYLPLTYDHRLVDGADAGRFLSAVRARLEEGAFEAELGL
ncbi:MULTISPECIES: 2-oxoglutarate dehydrogenase, E2 component, dihydrolipoamide succinyltransferase [Pseudonocardia]|uniref:Dihydrolipoamide acetyltransferase component of pyruvate dehydrogenase complex n=2 Tax=Pseudonocardia TaxID=1847 RepID=A0A1Y2MQD4_PSEAH|nr:MULTISPECIES: 2-oxoglutarate dehydrogenase, E2 component, dihydrolipoamide succinyltransferase [Pseudonocardia]OSY37443.1 Dihydrolipoyllysine-residue acetyltransferase component of pyruvate dehydrogenase complex [Pseudonocardia autotrophica]TDN77232.1 2-oxoglutarate dehydrogenase E2 component [Pseudonocardia autotrophica]BBG01251.1 hypothetical protein Pdca_24600 [Pseudonocardia autotrophica]GEC25978.1 hypothetical protein PSA01_30070 [Pseudonocardia saturnea]